MGKNNNQENKNVKNIQIPDFQQMFQKTKGQGNGSTINNDTMQSAMKDLQEKIKSAQNSENKGEVIQSAVFEMLQNMGLNIPADVIDKMKSKMRDEK